MGLDNFRYNQEGMDEYIGEAKAKNEQIKDIGDMMIAEVRQNLLEEGITGTTAEALITSFKAKVIDPMMERDELAEASIAKAETVQQLMEDNSAENTRIASQI
jgi:hypothetical protein